MSLAHTLPPEPVTAAAYDRFLDTYRGDERFDLIDGEIIMMTAPTAIHSCFATNVGAAVRAGRRDHGCRVYIGDLGIQRRQGKDETYRPTPDVVVRCLGQTGSKTLPPATRSLFDAAVVVEVHSPSTIDVGRGRKLEFFKSIPSLQHIVYIYQDNVRVEVSSRAAKNAVQDSELWEIPFA